MFLHSKPFQTYSNVHRQDLSSLPKWKAPERCSTCLYSNLKLQTLNKYKHSILLRIFVNYGRKFFHNIGPRLDVRTSFVQASSGLRGNKKKKGRKLTTLIYGIASGHVSNHNKIPRGLHYKTFYGSKRSRVVLKLECLQL